MMGTKNAGGRARRHSPIKARRDPAHCGVPPPSSTKLPASTEAMNSVRGELLGHSLPEARCAA